MSEFQGRFEFTDMKENISFRTIKGKCSCGRKYSVKRCSLALEMTIICPDCGKVIKVGETRIPSL